MDPRIVARLRCPACRSPLAPVPGGGPGRTAAALGCPAGHRFDLARQGYADLAGGRVTHAGDTAEMVAARSLVQDAGHFDFLGAELSAAAAEYRTGLFVDVGAGTGAYLGALLERRPEAVGLAIDVSKAALRRAARAHPRLSAVRADAWRGLPLADGAASVLLNVFAPRAGREFARVLAPGGRLVVVTPCADHLRELALAVRVDPRKDERLTGTLGPWFVRENEHEIRATLRLSDVEAAAVIGMGPGAHHRKGPVRGGAVTAAVRVSTWRLGED